MKAKLIKTDKGNYILVDSTKVVYDKGYLIGSSRESEVLKLSKQNCDEIFGVVDVELMADFYGASVKGSLDFKFGANKGFEDGFNKAMELNKDKVFTVEDMRTAMLNAIEMTDFQKEQFRKDNDYHIALDIIQSLQQPTEIEVEIESKIAIDGHTILGYELDSEGQLILKKI
jgi:hypothetical protein